jgi:hypothetical protein
MSDDSPPKPKHGTVPGFGPPSQMIAPLRVQPFAVDDETTVEPSPALAEAHSQGEAEISDTSRELQDVVQMVVEATPHVSEPMHEAGSKKARPKGPPAVDIDLVYEHRSAPLPDQPWTFLEIWTRNTIYQLDSSLLCIEVIDQGTRRAIANHPLHGARLVGGQSRDGDAMELSHPFPRPGSEAVFEQSSGRHVRFSQTSPVMRVVMRLRVLTVEPEQLLPTWEDVSCKWDRAAMKRDEKKK